MAATGRTALYRAFDVDGALLYIGITDSPIDRFKQHQSTAEWWPLMVLREVEWLNTRSDAEQAEARAIKAEAPKFNKSTGQGPEHEPYFLPSDVAAFVPAEKTRRDIRRHRKSLTAAELRLEQSVRAGRAAGLSYYDLAQLSGLSDKQVRRITSTLRS
ncbi:GIY-YIG nuclease family protein [Streptomyces sp. NPDC101175]|uniref:GIY-YIG nuclease family protein n=1 Tax=Streptomyces sp. NPDC101175 TaxID=3366123 RepID=UPI003833CC7F